MKIVNLTPHPLNLLRPDGSELTVDPDPSGPARVETVDCEVDRIDGIPVYRTKTTGISGLPDSEPGTVFVVSGFVRTHVPDQPDLMSPSHLVRDEDGRVIGCRGLVCS